MDNITHTLLGALVGDAAHRFVPVSPSGLPERTRRCLGMGLMMVGSNLPDLDFLYSELTGVKLDFLLQHRGYTHTIATALLIAAALWYAWRSWIQRRGLPCSRADLRFLAGLALLAPLVHIGLDYTNNYGVHPFWPLDNRWYYGDAVFIIEPLLWACASPLLFTLRTRTGRSLVALPLVAAPMLGVASGLVPIPFVLTWAGLLLLLLVLGWRLPARSALTAGVAAWLGITALFVASGRTADARIAAVVQRAFPSAITLDQVLTPLPADPVCRELLLVQLDGQDYVVRRGLHSLAPEWLPASSCPLRGGEQITAPLRPVAAASTTELYWAGEISMPRQLLDELRAKDCSVQALLRFARVPWSAQLSTGRVMGDLRYDREPGNGFAEITLGSADATCPRMQPGWVPPRQDLLAIP